MLRYILAAIGAAAIALNPLGPVQAISDPPSPPLNVEAVPGNASARIGWRPPENDGGSPIHYYTVTADPGPATCTTPDDATKCTVTGLTNGTSYTFTVTATNSDDQTSKPSDPSDPVTPYTVPDPPTLAFLWPSDQTLQARWWVSGDGGSVLLDYTATAQPGGHSCTVAASSQSCYIGGLTNGQTYSVTVVARNAAGYSVASNALSNSPYGPPSKATDVTAVAGKGSAVVTWVPPTDDGGRPLSYYRVETDGRDCVTATTTCAVTGLVAGREYGFRVLAYNTGNRSSISDFSDVVTPSGGPSGPDGGPTLIGWGRNEYGVLGDGTTDAAASPRPAYLGGDAADKHLLAVAGGWEHACAVDAAGLVYCWGSGLFSDSSTLSLTPVVQPGLPGPVSQVAAGLDFGCALSSGRAYCWGTGSDGQLGTGTYASTATPKAVSTDGVLRDKTLVALAAGLRHACAIDTAGAAYCWGNNGSGQLGAGAHSPPVPAPVAVVTSGSLTGVRLTNITAGTYFTCAADAAGDAFCWGDGSSGQLGNGASTDSDVPVLVGRVAGRDLTAGAAHSCAIDSQGQVRCWGSNYSGQLGDGTNTFSSVPVTVDAGDCVAVAASSMSACSLSGDGSARCWGEGRSGELGDGTTSSSSVPVAVDNTGVLADKAIVDMVGSGNSFLALAASAPEAPGTVSATAGDASATVAWTAPADHGGPIDSYRVLVDPGGATCNAGATACTFEGLTNGTTYTITIAAHNLVGWGPAATSNPVTPQAQPPKPPGPPTAPAKVKGLRSKVMAKTARVSWQATPGATGYQYRLRKPHKKYGAWHATSKARVMIRHPKKGTYRVQVRAQNLAGTGPVATVRFRVRH